MKKLIDAPCESNINTVAEGVSHKKMYILILLILFEFNDEIGLPSTLLNKASNKLNLVKK